MSGTFTETWYRLCLRAFPPGHRNEYGAEMLGTLLDGPPRRTPSPRETAGLMTAGFIARFRQAAASTSPWWADGIHLGLLTLSLANLSYCIADHTSVWWLAVSTALVITLLRGWVPLAVPLALLVALSTGRAMLFGASTTAFLGPAYVNWVSLAPYGMLAIGAVALLLGRPKLRSRPWWWLAIPAAAVVLAHAPGIREYGETWQLFRAGTEAVLLLIGVWATAAARSPRWALAAALYVLPGAASALADPPPNVQDTGYWLTLTALLLAMTATAWRPARS
ncbi:hypothetical protein [Actinomadura violacea]|uniref:Integral membrane protein n=1 Tax=Actinomadura violacea TaxID=2819934 RepID=A0ABS3RUD8_9ACTN|nr:hypothetical protein [Actinomadura violacea]MBO2460380.1 hypothetical protein [Actinomadura violacea]